MSMKEVPMTCQHIEEYLSSYMDGELEGNEKTEIEEHLTACSLCRGRVEEEKKTKELLAKKVLWVKAPNGLRDRVLTEINSASDGFLEKVLSIKPFPAIAAATVGVAVVFAVILYLRSEPPLMASPVLVESVNDHIQAISRESPVDFATSNQEDLVDWFRGKVSIPIHSPSMEGWNLMGGKICHLSDRRVACLIYEKDGEFISLYMCEGSGIPLEGMKEHKSQGMTHLCGSHLGYHGLFWKDGDLLSFFVASLGDAELAELACNGK
jgi:mycothiol system anti-sigma-R factor